MSDERDPALRGSITSLPDFFAACSMVGETLREKVSTTDLDDCDCELCAAARNIWQPMFRSVVKAVLTNHTPAGTEWGDGDNLRKRQSCAIQALARLFWQICRLYRMDLKDGVEILESAYKRADLLQDLVDDNKVDLAWFCSKEVAEEVADSEFFLAVAEIAMNPLLKVRITDKPVNEEERTNDDLVIAIISNE